MSPLIYNIVFTTTFWRPPHNLLLFTLIAGAILTANLTLLVLTFYEDHYWSDKKYREELRLNSQVKKKKA